MTADPAVVADALVLAVEDGLRRRDHRDPYLSVRAATDTHRHDHGCWAYPYQDGTVLGAVAAAAKPARVLELGTALGYTSCWWASRGAHVDTIERDPLHVQLARENIERAGLRASVTVHEGDFDMVVPSLTGPFDLIFFDGYEPPARLLEQVTGSLREHGVVVTTNLDLGERRARSRLGSADGWSTRFVADLALSVRAPAAGRRP
ncbi:MAG: O-methyltransferase [Jatrophihabitans sp.]|uniref:O-methyltransferase n=1 Tax=Jatrophihabitans sp. TaxID=1932789 RepID=UPI003F7FF648